MSPKTSPQAPLPLLPGPEGLTPWEEGRLLSGALSPRGLAPNGPAGSGSLGSRWIHGFFSYCTFWGRHQSWKVWRRLLRMEGLK